MKIYEPKTLFTGYKIGLGNQHLYIGVPSKYFQKGIVFVKKNGNLRSFNQKNKATQETFNDKFRPGETYTLYYFLWKRVKEKVNPEEDQQINMIEYTKNMGKLAKIGKKVLKIK